MSIRLFTLVCIVVLSLCHGQMIYTESKLSRDGNEYTVYQRTFKFNDSALIYKYILQEGVEGIVKEKWGDYFFGLPHGTINNGGWCVWNFLEVFSVSPDGKEYNVLSAKPAVNAGQMRVDSGQMAELTWDGGLSLRMIQCDGNGKWLFARLKWQETQSVRRILLRAWPGGTHWIAPGRERHLICNGKDYYDAKNNQTIPFETHKYNAVVLYNRNYSERNGNFLVFQGQNAQSLSVTPGDQNTVTLTFIPQGNEFNFALGYFLNEDSAEAAQRFTIEQFPGIANTLETVEWDAQVDSLFLCQQFDRLNLLLNNLKAEADISQKHEQFIKEMNGVRLLFNKACNSKSPALASEALQAIDDLRTRAANAWLNTLK